MARAQITVSDLEGALEQSVATLGRAVRKDWTVPAGTLRWSCGRTVFHVADDLVAYAGQLASRQPADYLAFRCRMPRGTTPAQLLDLVGGMGALLATTVRAAQPGDRGWHPHGVADAEGFTALGVMEVLLHTVDAAGGLRVRYRPDRDLCAQVTARLFPEVEPHPDPVRLLMWSVGRADLPGRAKVRGWRTSPAAPAERVA